MKATEAAAEPWLAMGYYSLFQTSQSVNESNRGAAEPWLAMGYYSLIQTSQSVNESNQGSSRTVVSYGILFSNSD